jgi:hypothetical protein
MVSLRYHAFRISTRDSRREVRREFTFAAARGLGHVLVIRFGERGSPLAECPLRSKSDRNAALPRNDAKSQERTSTGANTGTVQVGRKSIAELITGRIGTRPLCLKGSMKGPCRTNCWKLAICRFGRIRPEYFSSDPFKLRLLAVLPLWIGERGLLHRRSVLQQ